jgi:RNA polymerase sigma factor (sigma-70 family)
MDAPRKNPHDINDIVKAYQQGNELAGEELLRIFGCHPDESVNKYIGKYYDLIRYGKMDFKNKDLRRFVSLFAYDPVLREKLKPFYQYADTKAATMKVVQKIVERFESVEDEDLLQDLRLLLLQQAMRYEKKGEKITFLGYLYNSYRFAVYNYYKWLFEDLLLSDRVDFDIEAMEQGEDESAGIEIDEAWFFEDVYFENETEELGFNWIHNRTATFPFNQLSVYERTIVFMHYEKKMTDKDVAAITGYHEDTIFTHRKRIKAKLKELLSNGEGYGR